MTAKPTDKDKQPTTPDKAEPAGDAKSAKRGRPTTRRKRSAGRAKESGDKTAGPRNAPKKKATKKAPRHRTTKARSPARTSATSPTARDAASAGKQAPPAEEQAPEAIAGEPAAEASPGHPAGEPTAPEQAGTPAENDEAGPATDPRRRRARIEDPEDPHALGIGSRVVPPVMAYEEDTEPANETPAPHDIGSFELTQQEVEAQIRALEARLDGMIRRAGGRHDDDSEPPPSIREQVGSAARAVVDRLAAPLPIERPGSDDGGVVDAVRELASSDYYIRQWGRIGMRNRSEEVDEFGLDPTYEKRLLPLFEFLYKRYFRTETRGIEHIPTEGRCLVVANHSGTLPLDGVMLRTAVRLEHPAARELRWLAEDFIYYLPFLGAFMNRIGAVRACQENAERLLKQGRLVGVFPEGVKGVGKLFRDRYRLQRFGRGGYIRLCLRTQTPLVPCAVVGAEETNPMLYRVEYLSRAFGLPYIPVTPTFPLLGPLGLMPAPTKWRIRFGEPIRFDEYGPEAADDHVLVGRLSEQVRTTIQRMLDNSLGERQSVWFG